MRNSTKSGSIGLVWSRLRSGNSTEFDTMTDDEELQTYYDDADKEVVETISIIAEDSSPYLTGGLWGEQGCFSLGRVIFVQNLIVPRVFGQLYGCCHKEILSLIVWWW